MWQSFVDGKNKLCVSNEILEEYIEILQRLTDNETAEYVVKTILNSPFVELITPFYHFNLITVDPDDNKFVDCAISANAHYIVTNDHHYGSPDKPGGLSIQLCKSEKKEFYIRYSS